MAENDVSGTCLLFRAVILKFVVVQPLVGDKVVGTAAKSALMLFSVHTQKVFISRTISRRKLEVNRIK